MVSPDRGMQIARLYHCRSYYMVHGIEVAKVGRQIKVVKVRQRIGISSILTRQTVILNCRSSVFLECMSSPDGECRSASYGVMKIRNLVASWGSSKWASVSIIIYRWLGQRPSIQKSARTNHPKGGNWWFVRIGLHGIQQRIIISS